jgi:hypothetical protein
MVLCGSEIMIIMCGEVRHCKAMQGVVMNLKVEDAMTRKRGKGVPDEQSGFTADFNLSKGENNEGNI